VASTREAMRCPTPGFSPSKAHDEAASTVRPLAQILCNRFRQRVTQVLIFVGRGQHILVRAFNPQIAVLKLASVIRSINS